MAAGRLTKDFTQGTLWRQLLLLALPFMASNALQVLYSTVDMVIVGHFVGTAGLSAVSQSSQVVNFAAMLCLGFSNAGQVLIAQALGADKKEKITHIIGTLFSLLTVLSLLLSAAFLLGRGWILDAVKMPQASREMAMDYLVICSAGLFFTAGYNMIAAVLRGMGDAKRPFLFIGIASAVNLVLDLIFTGWWGWGVAGAAWATVIGQAVSFLFSLWYLFRRRDAFGFDLRKGSLAIRKKYALPILSIGAPMAVQSGFINLSMLFVNALVNEVGVVASATFGVGIRIDDIINKISQGIQYAAVPVISQNIGAHNNERAKQTVYWAWIFSAVWTVVCMAVYLLLGEQLFMLFSDDAAVHAMCHTFIGGILCIFPALALMRGSGAFIQGIGNARLSMVLALLDGVVLRIGLSYLFGTVFGWGFFGFVLGYALAPYGFSVPSVIYFLAGKWQKRRVLADDI